MPRVKDPAFDRDKLIPAIQRARENGKNVKSYFSSIKESLDWLLIEMEDFESGELDASYNRYINICLSIYNRAIRDIKDCSDTLRQNINDLNDWSEE